MLAKSSSRRQGQGRGSGSTGGGGGSNIFSAGITISEKGGGWVGGGTVVLEVEER